MGRAVRLTVLRRAVDPLLVFGEVGGRDIVSKDGLLARPRAVQLLLLAAPTLGPNLVT